MVEIINTSFIPKQAIGESQKTKSGFRINVFFLMALVVFLSTLIGTVAVWLWKIDIEKTNKEYTTRIDESRGDYGEDTIRAYAQLSNRINTAELLLTNHHNVLPIFQFLERNTQTNIVLTQLTLEEHDKLVIIKSSGLAPALSDLYLQSKSYANNQNVEGLILSNISRTKEGLVSFNLEFEVNKENLTGREFSSN